MTRLRWRLAGATMWPAFALAVLAGTLLLHHLPFAGERGLGIVPAFLVSGFLFLAVVAVLAPAGGLLLRRREPALPKEVADDRAGTVALGLVVLALLAGGLVHRPVVARERDDFALQAAVARTTLQRRAPAPFRPGLGRLNTWQPGPSLYRTCAPAPGGREAFCVLISTAQHPPGVSIDPDRRPNEVVAGPRNPGRRGG